jgi:hypothetical protein
MDNDLHPDLAAYIEEGGHWPMLRHPLVYHVPYAPQMNAFLNQMYKQKMASVEKAEAEGNWSAYIWWHERPWRLWAFLGIEQGIEDDAEWWELLGTIWEDSENIHQNRGIWEDLFLSPRPSREYLMDEEERAFLVGLPDSFLVYRGCSAAYTWEGLSWTLDKDKALWFAHRFSKREGVVIAGEVKKQDVLAYLGGRGEKEILVHWSDVEEVEIGDSRIRPAKGKGRCS